MKKTIIIVVCLAGITLILLNSCKGHKDCQGNRHTVKTEMGGWL